MIPALKHNVKLKENYNGALLIDNNNLEYKLISSLEAFLLALFDGKRTIDDIIDILIIMKGSPQRDDLEKEIYNYINNRRDLVEMISVPDEGKSTIDPYKFLSKINMEFAPPKRLESPLSLCLYLTRRCNLNCVYCFANARYINNQGQNRDIQCYEMSLEKIKQVVDQMADIGIKSVTLTGGEVTLRPDLLEIIKHIGNYAIKIILPTNACLINDKLAQDLRKVGIYEIQTKLDAACPETQDRLSRVDGSYSKLISGIKNLKEYSFEVQTVSVISSWNINEIPKVIEILLDLEVDKIIPRIYAPGIYSLQGRGGAYLNPSKDSLIYIENIIEDYKKKYNGKINSLDSYHLKKKVEKEVASCPAFISTCTILENGLVIPCEMLADTCDKFIIGNINIDKFMDIWNSHNAENWISRKNQSIGHLCTSCGELARCMGGCAWKAIVAYGDWTCDPTCIKAPIPTKIPFAGIE